jgi:hypothetical protein
MRHPRPALAALGVVPLLALTACASGSSTAAGPPAAASSATASTASSAPASSGSPTASPAAAASTPAADPASAKACSLLDEAGAATILGGAITKSAAGDVGDFSDEDGAGTKLDGCLYTGARGSIGYDVVRFGGVSSEQLFAMAKAKAAAQLKSGKAEKYASSVPGTISWTLALGTGTTSIVSAVKDGWFVTVSGARKASSPRESQAVADAATQAILDRI